MASKSGNSDQAVYAAGQAREYLANALEGKENTWIYEYAGYIRDGRVLDWLNYRCSLYAERGEDFLETELAKDVIRSAATRTADHAFGDGNASELQGIVGLTRHEKDANDAMAEIVDRLADEGCVALIVGPPGAGKTATTLDAARAWGVRTGGYMFGNTSWDGFDGVVGTDVEMLEAMAGVDGQTLGVVDESNQNLSGEGADSKKAQTFVDRMTFIRKKEGKHGRHAKRGSLLIVGHTEMKTAADIRRLATLVIQNPSRADPGKVVLYESPGGQDKRDKIGEYKGLTDTRESYSEHEASHFDIVLDDDDDEDGDAVDVKDVEKRKDIETAIRAVKPWDEDAGMSYPEAAGLVPYADSWVGNRVREWKDGDHREIVGEPSGGNA
ncbi:hypothetical protein G9C85_06260 [Halorubellus sp. JP-L1]|uniref:hypothetical protein n=1 Tax=Halorubellus sp. JP-L1 TaxID=2715753 RepID=UPI00140B8CF6|nr:hypothetical protein [Halorubellus sp. JP-L1]NHN41240.1 hypothetical protein [Halorubellus sp. JP-L1]